MLLAGKNVKLNGLEMFARLRDDFSQAFPENLM